MEVYMDDMITKSINEVNNVRDLEETFKILKSYAMKLNPKKCPFGVRSGKFLGHMIDQRGIEANPDKVQVVLRMKFLVTVKEVKRLIGCIATLERFMSRSVDKCLPFLKVLRKKVQVGWNEEAERAIQSPKEYLQRLPQIVNPSYDEPLLLL